MLLTCPCGASFPMPARGRIPTYCSPRCRLVAHRKRHQQSIPAELRNVPQWTRRDRKRPITVDGRAASSTNRATWSTFADAQRGPGDGFGVMLGNGLACYDLDHCLTDGELTPSPEQAEVLRRVKPIYAEVSMSGDGLHLFVRAPEGPGTKTANVEFYSRARFIAVTGNRWDKEGHRATQAPSRRH